MRITAPSIFLLTILLAPPAGAEVIAIGETALPRGMNALPDRVECLEPPCTDHVFWSWADSRYFSPELALTGPYLLEGPYTDLDGVIRLEFDTPLRNQDGPDLYIGQADYIGGDLAFGAVPVNELELAFDGGPFHHVSASGYVLDPLPARIVTHSDGGALEQSAYLLRYRTFDLADFGYGPGEPVTTLEIRGQSPTTIDEDGPDIAAVASLSRSRLKCGLGLELVFVLPPILSRLRRR
jgi:hypothetical protein